MRSRSCALWAAVALVLSGGSVSAESFQWSKYATKGDDWFRGKEGGEVVENVLSHQSPAGSWPKNVDTARRAIAGDPKKLRGTFDNGATLGETRLLARAYKVTAQARYKEAVHKAHRPHPRGAVSDRRLAAVLSAQQAIPPAHHLQRQRDGQRAEPGPRRGRGPGLRFRRPAAARARSRPSTAASPASSSARSSSAASRPRGAPSTTKSRSNPAAADPTSIRQSAAPRARASSAC